MSMFLWKIKKKIHFLGEQKLHLELNILLNIAYVHKIVCSSWLMLSMLVKPSADDILKKYSCFPQKIIS